MKDVTKKLIEAAGGLTKTSQFTGDLELVNSLSQTYSDAQVKLDKDELERMHELIMNGIKPQGINNITVSADLLRKQKDLMNEFEKRITNEVILSGIKIIESIALPENCAMIEYADGKKEILYWKDGELFKMNFTNLFDYKNFKPDKPPTITH